MTNSDIVDPTDAAVAALIAFVHGTSVGFFGQTLTFVKGIRSRKKQMKR